MNVVPSSFFSEKYILLIFQSIILHISVTSSLIYYGYRLIMSQVNLFMNIFIRNVHPFGNKFFSFAKSIIVILSYLEWFVSQEFNTSTVNAFYFDQLLSHELNILYWNANIEWFCWQIVHESTSIGWQIIQHHVEHTRRPNTFHTGLWNVRTEKCCWIVFI